MVNKLTPVKKRVPVPIIAVIGRRYFHLISMEMKEKQAEKTSQQTSPN